MPHDQPAPEPNGQPPAAQTSLNPFAGGPIRTNAAAETSKQTAVSEVQGRILMAKRLPRDPIVAMDRILNACTRHALADSALYEYARGGSAVTGPSIRLAEVLAQNWGNIDCGVRELEQRNGESTVEAFAWDVETGFRDSKVFQVPHIRYLAPKNGNPARTYKLEDPRDIYEHVANNAARRKRACILAVIPGDVIEAAVQQCELTLKTKAEVTPERLVEVLEKFAEYGVTKEAIEKRIQRRLEAMTPAQLVGLRKIMNSLRDGMSKPAEWFDLADPAAPAQQSGEPTGNGKGAAGLKAGAAKAAAATKKPAVDANAPKYSEIATTINKATSKEEVELALSMLHPGIPEDQQTELRELAEQRILDVDDVR